MSRYLGGGRATTSGYLFLDVRYLQRNGYLRPGSSSSQRWSCRGEPSGSINLSACDGYVKLSYRTRDRGSEEWEQKEYPVSLEWTRCNYGGERAWFRCPAARCGRRVAILYGGSIFACRRCHNLAYDSQAETRHGRMLLKAQAIRERLGGTPCVADEFPTKPKGMHWRTYYRLRQKSDEAEDQSWPPWVLKMMKCAPDG
jgi:hypothetical protein